MISGLSKLKWVVLFLLLPVIGITANANGFVLQLKGPEVHTPSSPSSYGPVVKADTLWSVATATRPNNSLSLYKTMAAILALNPHAFLDGNINKMIDGSMLKIPSAAEIQATDGSALRSLLTKKTGSAPKPAATNKTRSPKPNLTVANKAQLDKLALLQGELTESNEHLLLSSETNRRLKLQLVSIRMELAELKEQMAIDNQLKAELKALIEQQKAQISEQQATIEEAKKQALLEAESHNNWWLIGGISGVFSLLTLVWLGLWLKNRNDQKNNIEENVMFDTDNTVDELSDYLNAESYSTDSAIEDAIPVPEEAKAAEKANDEINSFAEVDLDEPNFNLQMESATNTFSDSVDDMSVAPTIVQSAAPITPEVIEQTPVMPELSLDDNDFSDIDLTLDDESTSFENDSVTPDLSWREELDEPSLIPEQPANTLDEDLAEVDTMLEQFKLSNGHAPEGGSADADFDFNSLNDLDVAAADDPSSAVDSPKPVDSPKQVDSPAEVKNDEYVNMDDIDSILAEAELEEMAQAAADDTTSDSATVSAANDVVDMDDIDSLLADAGLDAIAESQAETVAATVDNQQTVDMDDIDSLLAEAQSPSPDTHVAMDDIDSILADAGLDEPAANNDAKSDQSNDQNSDELPQAHGQTVDEMLAELDGAENVTPEKAIPASKDTAELDDIEAMLAEFSPNAFSAEPSEQPPIDVAAAQAEEFIDIDKLLNEASTQAANIEDEPYDQVKLDVGLDEYSNTLLDNNAVDIDDETNRFGAQLDLARAYLEIEDTDGAKSILEPLAGVGDAAQQAEVNKLLSRL